MSARTVVFQVIDWEAREFNSNVTYMAVGQVPQVPHWPKVSVPSTWVLGKWVSSCLSIWCSPEWVMREGERDRDTEMKCFLWSNLWSQATLILFVRSISHSREASGVLPLKWGVQPSFCTFLKSTRLVTYSSSSFLIVTKKGTWVCDFLSLWL